MEIMETQRTSGGRLSILILGLFICVLYPCITDYMIWCFEVIIGNLALTELVVSKEMILGKSISFLLSLQSLILFFCVLANDRFPCFHFYPNSCPLRNIYLNLQEDHSSFYIWALEQQNRKPKVLVSNSSWDSRSLAHHRCPLWILIWHARSFL